MAGAWHGMHMSGDRGVAAYIYITDDFGDAEADADEGIGEGHDGREDGEPRHLVEVGYLRQHHLREAEEEHVEDVPSHGARRVVAFLVVAVGLLNRPATRARVFGKIKMNAGQRTEQTKTWFCGGPDIGQTFLYFVYRDVILREPCMQAEIRTRCLKSPENGIRH